MPKLKKVIANGKKPLSKFQLTEGEKLKLENIQLKRQLLLNEQRHIDGEQARWRAEIETRLDIDTDNYVFDVSKGEATLKAK